MVDRLTLQPIDRVRYVRECNTSSCIHKIIALPNFACSTVISNKLKLLRLKGDHIHNLKAVEVQKGKLVLARKTDTVEFKLDLELHSRREINS